MSQEQTHHHRDEDESEPAVPVERSVRQGHGDGLDVLIDDIETILDDAAIAEEYLQKGGQ